MKKKKKKIVNVVTVDVEAIVMEFCRSECGGLFLFIVSLLINGRKCLC